MSMNIIKKNSSSPFLLQRSMVNQGGEGGVYEEGGYNPNAVYSDGGISDAIAGVGGMAGKILANRTAADKNKSDIKTEARQEARSAKTESKIKSATIAGDTDKAKRLTDRNTRVETRKASTTADIKKYNETEKATLKSDIKTETPKTKTKSISDSSVGTSVVGSVDITNKSKDKTAFKNPFKDLGENVKNIFKKTIN